MRKIKFRAKEYGKNGKWVYAEGLSELANFFYGLSDGQLDSETLTEFTGLKDKNGKECFGGDKVKNNLTNHKGIVRWNNDNACFYVSDEKDKWIRSMGAFNSDGFTIEGNIWE